MERSSLNDIGSLILVAGLAVGGLKQCDGAAITCPTLREYSQDFLKAAATEMKQVKITAPHVATLIDDAGVDRDAIRKCIELRGKAKKR